MRKSTKQAFDRQVAVMKQDEEARGLWCVCGHSSPTHDVGFTCQSVACDCLNFRPSNAKPGRNQFRPGPWRIEEDNPRCVTTNDGMIYVAEAIQPEGTEDAEAIANARLIAAAPALYAALKAFEVGFADGSIKFTKKRQADDDPYHPANTLMCAALALVEEGSDV